MVTGIILGIIGLLLTIAGIIADIAVPIILKRRKLVNSIWDPATWVWVLKSEIEDFRQADLMVTNPCFHAWSNRNGNPILTARFTEC